MLAKLFLVFLVAYASASHYAWKPNTEYTYRISGRSLSGLIDHDPTMSGILLKSELRIVPRTPDVLSAKLHQSQYCRVQRKFLSGWEEDEHESDSQYRPLPISEEPFEIHLQDGIVKDVLVSKTLKNWEANMIKSVVSQIQLNVNAKHPIDSDINVLPRGKSPVGVFKVMEKTVTGEFETIYVMKPEFEDVWPTLPKELEDANGEHYSISKSKNYTSHGPFAEYHFGFGEMETSEPNTDSMGIFANRTSTSHAVIYGNLEDYVIKVSNTSNVISFSPLYNNHQSGIVASKMSLVLKHIQPGKTYGSPSNPIQVGIIYQYDTAYGNNNVESSHVPQEVAGEYEAYDRPGYQRLNSLRPKSARGYHLDQSQLELDQPSMSMDALATGFEGKAIKFSDKVDIVNEAKKLAHEIGADLQHPNEIPERSTISKFVLLVRLCKQMNKQEMHHASEGLYSNEQHGINLESWKVFRDAVAHAASGPSLLIVREWIQNNKIDEHEASSIVSRMAMAARHPTAKYLRGFQKLVEESIEKRRESVNDTAVISYADLLYKVCVHKELSHQHYPFHTYGSFDNAECHSIVKEYIRYLDQHLQKSVAESHSHNIIVYSVALGKVAHRDIYRSLERYIKQTPARRHQVPEQHRVTEFQRFVMINSMSRFAVLYPEAAQEFLSSIYFSPSESQEVRTAAVYLIAHSEPETSLLTAMAQYTQIDKNEYANSAVKSTIRQLVEMGYEPAYHAERYLNDEEYGAHHPHNIYFQYVQENMHAELRESLRTYGGVDHMIPKGIQGKLELILGGAHFNLATYDVVVSSIEEVFNAFEHQTEHYHEQVQKKKSHLKDDAHSTHKIYEALGMHVEEREQLEGLLNMRIGDAFSYHRIDNYTVHSIPEIVKQWQEDLKAGHKFSLTKWAIDRETVMSAPTEMGLPYSYALGIPSLWSLDGKLQAESRPEISQGSLLHAPEHIQADAELHALAHREYHSSIRFYTPFEHHDYVSGYVKKSQIHLPLSVKVNADLKNEQITCHLKAIQPERDSKLFHYSTIPYTAKHDLLSIKPIEASNDYIVLTRRQPHRHAIEFGKRSVGMQFQLSEETDHEEHTSWNRFLQSIHRHGAAETAMRFLYDDTILYSKIELLYKGSESVNREVKLQAKYAHKHYEHQQGSSPSVQDILSLPTEQHVRIGKVVEKAAAALKSVNVIAGDVHIKFAGPQEFNIHAGAACARGPVDKNSRIITYIHTEPKSGELKPWNLVFLHDGESPNTNGLDYEYALRMNPKIKSSIKLALGEKHQLSTVEVESEFQKTPERVHYLQEHPQHHECHNQMKEGNHILPHCANMTAHANLLDDATIRIKYDGISKYTKEVIQKIVDLARPCASDEFEFERLGKHQNEVELKLHFSPDLHHANYTLEGVLATELNHTCEHIPVNRWQRQLFVLHPVFPVTTRLMAEAHNIGTYRPICIVDKTRAASFDGKEYDAKLSDSWTVMLHYLPHFANHSLPSDLKYRQHHQIREHVVLVRHEDHGKAVKIVLRTGETEQKLVEVELRPTGQPSPKVKVLVNKNEVHYDQHQSKDFHERAIRVYGLPNEEVKIEIDNHYYVIADGQRVKLTTTSSLFNNATRGLCGNFNGLETDDFILPSGEISMESSQKFVNAYTIGSPHQKQAHRVRKEHSYVQIPSFERIEELTHQRVENAEASSCTAHRTLYVRKNNKDCFSVRAYPVCKPGCQPKEEVAKKIDLICLNESSASQQWRRKAEAGDSLRFQDRQPNDHTETKIHLHCQQ